MYMKKYDLKKLFLEERPQLNQYLNRIDFSMNQVISMETLSVESTVFNPSTRRFVFKGMGFVFSIDTNDEYSFFRPDLKFNEIHTDAQAG